MVPVMAKTFEQVKKEFFNTRVITNNRLPKRGESHKIAVKLGLIDQKQSTYALYTTNFIGPLSYQAFSFLKLLALS